MFGHDAFGHAGGPAPVSDSEARILVVDRLATTPRPWEVVFLARLLTRLGPEPDDLSLGRTVLLGQLGAAQPRHVARLAQTLARLGPTPEEETLARTTVVDRLAVAGAWDAAKFARALPHLSPTDDVLAVARAALLAHVVAADARAAAECARALAGNRPRPKELALARAALLAQLRADAWHTRICADALALLRPTRAEQVEVRAALLRVLDESTGRHAAQCARTLLRLRPTKKEMRQARAVVGGYLADDPDASAACASAFIHLMPTAQELAEARAAVVRAIRDYSAQHSPVCVKALLRLDPAPDQRLAAGDALLNHLAQPQGTATKLRLLHALTRLSPNELHRRRGAQHARRLLPECTAGTLPEALDLLAELCSPEQTRTVLDATLPTLSAQAREAARSWLETHRVP